MKKAVIFDMFETLITHYRTPIYDFQEIVADLGVEKAPLEPLWHPLWNDRSVGKVTFEQAVTLIMEQSGTYSESLLAEIVRKRVDCKKELFSHLHDGIIPMLEKLRSDGIKTGLISDCLSEETDVIRNSNLAPYLDAVCLSFDEGVKKPDPQIYLRCLDRLNVGPGDCLYIGDGGSDELDGASALGITALQAGWYLSERGTLDKCRKSEYPLLLSPHDVFGFI